MKKLISILLAATILFSCFSGCSRKKKNETDETSSTDTITTKKTTANVEGPKTGPVGTWSIPAPEINPLGSQDLYDETSYSSNSTSVVNYLENYTQNSKKLQGESWAMRVNDNSGIPLEFLKEYVQELGGTVFSSAYGDRLTFTYKKDNESLWWGDAISAADGYELTVVKQRHLPVGKEVKFSTKDIGDEGEPEITFVTQTEGKRFQSAKKNQQKGSLSLEITGSGSTGSYKRDINYNREISSIKTNEYILDDLPQGSDALTWKFTWESGNAPDEFSVILEELGEIPQVKYGDELGALKVSGYLMRRAYVVPQENVTYDSSETINYEGDSTPEGDQLFWLPPGYYNVMLPSDAAGLDETKTRLVPVSSGEMTVLNVPQSLVSAYSTLNLVFAEPWNMTGGIDITEARDEGSTATICFSVNDPSDRDVFPDKENTTINEGGQKVEILEITRKILPPSIVLVLDSSGSMGNLMPATIESAKRFINGLPDGTFVRVIDFDTEVRLLNGETKETVIKSMSSIKALGYTKLFDATLEGLRLLVEEDINRPALVVFADGADSSLYEGEQEQGSSSSKDDVIDAIKEAGIPLYTIGFRDDADKQALKEFATASGGQYFDAKDNKALDSIFEAIGSKFGNLFEIKYKRPTELNLSDTPVVSLIMDASGSMDIDPAEEEGCDYRIDKTKALFHDFVQMLPDECLMQMISFQTGLLSNQIKQNQIITGEKSAILQAIGSMRADGGTPILEAVRIGYENLRAVPTNKKVMVFVTDAGLELDEYEKPEFDKILEMIKKDSITVLWAGMGVTDKEELFKNAAELSGGRYVVKENVEDLKSALNELLGLMKKESESKIIPLSITINEKAPSGDIYSYAAATNCEFTRPAKVGKTAAPETVKITTGTRLNNFDSNLSALVTGISLPGEDTILNKRISLDAKSSNKAADISVKEAFFFEKFKGLDGRDMQFVALQLEIKNITAQKITYQIPDFKSHFYLNVNNEGAYPASEATWLTEKPLAAPGEVSFDVQAGKTASGILVFLVPEEPVNQFSLHFYDTGYGHLLIPLTGKMENKLIELDSLPTVAPVKITDAFSMTLKSVDSMDAIQKYPAAENTTFRVIEADFDTKVQALLDIDPAARFYLNINTGAGPLMTKMSNATALLPFGFMSPVMLAPSSPNKVRMAYPIAKSLLGVKSEIWADLDSGSLQIPVVKGDIYGGSVNKPTVSAFDMQLRINQLTTLEGIKDFSSNMAVADVTFICPAGVQSSMIPEDMFTLVREDYLELFESGGLAAGSNEESPDDSSDGAADEEHADNEPADNEEEYYDEEEADNETEPDDEYTKDEDIPEDDGNGATGNGPGLGDFTSFEEYSEGIRTPDSYTSSLLYGIDEEWTVFSGTQRRGLVLFNIPDNQHKWILKSNYFTNLNETLAREKYTSADLLAADTHMELLTEDFEKELEQAVQKAIQKYQSYKSAEGGAGYVKTLDLTQGDGKNYIPMPTIVTHGIQKIRSISKPDQAISTMKTLKWLPAAERGKYRYSPEAVLTQGWGTEWDLGFLAASLLSKCGSNPKFRNLALTEEGIVELAKLCNVNALNCKQVPGIKYTDAGGNAKVFVVPFMKDITELEGLVYFTASDEASEILPAEVSITVYAMTESKGNTASSAVGDIGDVLGGGESADGTVSEDIELLTKTIALPDLSNDVIEVGYAEAGPGTESGKMYMAVLSTSGGLEPGEYAVDTGKSKVKGIKIEIELPAGVVRHISSIPESDTLDKVYHNIAINLPDLTEEAAAVLEAAASKEYKAAQNPSSFSALKWYGRNIINRFIATQSIYDADIGEKMGLTLGRTNKERCLVVTSRISSKDNILRTSMDLVQAVNQYHNGDGETQKAYNAGAGLFVSLLEGEVIPGENTNFQKLWQSAPEGTKLVYIPGGDVDRLQFIEPMREYGFPEYLISRIEENNNVIYTTDKAIEFGGEKRWMWLEVNPVTYDTISVSDTGEHMGAGYVQTLMRSIIQGGAKFMAGAFFGIETAVWAVASYSLLFGDYENILLAAEITTKMIGKHVALMESVSSDPLGTVIDMIKEDTGLDDLTADKKDDWKVSPNGGGMSVGGGGMTASINVADLCKMDLSVSMDIKIPGFGEGFNKAAELYFELARK